LYSSPSAAYIARCDLSQGEIHVKGVLSVAAVQQFKAHWPVRIIQAPLLLPMHGPWCLAKTLLSGSDMGWDSGNIVRPRPLQLASGHLNRRMAVDCASSDLPDQAARPPILQCALAPLAIFRIRQDDRRMSMFSFPTISWPLAGRSRRWPIIAVDKGANLLAGCLAKDGAESGRSRYNWTSNCRIAKL
jgi:hypothetical protein